jgi:peroxiredoxin
MSSSLVLLCTLFIVGIVAHAASPAAEVGKPAPPFALTDVNGKAVALGDFKGKIVVLEWTNPNCPFVQRVYRQGIMTDLQKKYVGEGIVWLTVNSTNKDHGDFETAESLRKTFGDWKASFTTLLMDPDGKVGKMFDARTTPHMFVIDQNGVLAYNGGVDDDPRGSSTTKVSYVGAALNELLEGKPVTIANSKPYGCSVKY